MDSIEATPGTRFVIRQSWGWPEYRGAIIEGPVVDPDRPMKGYAKVHMDNDDRPDGFIYQPVGILEREA